MEWHYTECHCLSHYAGFLSLSCCIMPCVVMLYVDMLKVIMLSVILLSVITLSVITPSVVAQEKKKLKTKSRF